MIGDREWMLKQRKRELHQIKRDLIREQKYVCEQVTEALGFIEKLEENFTNGIGRQLLARLRRLEIDEDLIEMMLLPMIEDNEE